MIIPTGYMYMRNKNPIPICDLHTFAVYEYRRFIKGGKGVSLGGSGACSSLNVQDFRHSQIESGAISVTVKEVICTKNIFPHDTIDITYVYIVDASKE